MKLGPFDGWDLLKLFSPPGTLYAGARLFLGRHSQGGKEPDRRDGKFVAEVLELLEPLLRGYFRARVRGGENLPAQGPALVVGNHSGGLLPFESFLVFREVMRRFGPEREIFGLAHDFLFDDPTLCPYGERFGAIRAGHGPARRAFQRGALVLVYPGSDFDAFRPWRDRHHVTLAGRTGFLTLALTDGVPIIPVVTCGAQEQFIILHRGERTARWLGLKKRLRTNVAPLALALPWGLAPAVLPYLPLPTQMTTQFGAPLHFPRTGPEAAADPDYLQECYARVEHAMQSMLDGLAAERGLPVLG